MDSSKTQPDQPPLIYIEWCDAIGQESWNSKETLIEWAKQDNWVVKEAGFLLDETKQYLLIANRCTENDDMPNYSCTTKIPKTWIVKRVNITF